MAVELKMPALSPTMEKGTLARWLVAVGDKVNPGDLIAEIETDKATMEYEAADEGIVQTLRIAEGTSDVPVGAVIAVLGDGGEVIAPAPAPAPETEPFPEAAPAPVRQHNGSATPLARRLAAARGIALDTIRGSGPNGRIVRADIAPPLAAPVAERPAEPLPVPDVPHETVRLSAMRRTIARRLSESKRQVPHFYLTVKCNLDPLLALRRELNAGLAARGIRLSVNDLLVRAMAVAMGEVPEVNVQFGGDAMHRFSRVDIAMAVAIEGGLVTPVLRDVGALSLTAIAAQGKALAEKARAGRLMPEDYQGGTASISNLGMFGIDEMVPVINPPQAMILGIGAGVEQPWKVDGAIALATIMAATGSFDHRVIDGAAGARFMAAFRELVEKPLAILA